MEVRATRTPFRLLAIGFGLLMAASACTGASAPATPATGASPTSGSPTPSSEGGAIGGDVTVWTAWGGAELDAFRNVLKPFEERTGIEVRLTTVRDVNQLAINVDAGTELPDVAFPPTPDKIPDWAQRGVMKALESFLDMADYTANTYPALLDIGVVDGQHYQLFVKTQVKGLFWYNAKVFRGPAPKTWDELLATPVTPPTKRFCVGLESGAASGWPATDMIENIVMRQSGAGVYNDWIAGKQKWTSPEIRRAFQTFGQLVSEENVYGGPNTVLTTNFGRAGKPLFTDPPGCLFLEQATFITNFFKEDYPNLQSVEDFDFFPHPSIDPAHDGNVEGFADSFVMYNDTPQARALMSYLATAEAQATFVAGGGTLAARKDVTNFPDPVFKRAADVAASAKNLLVDASDNMPSDMNAAFWKATLDFTKDQSKLDAILTNLDQVQAASYGS
ncbi:MAG TPA: extracellular solute-binding protein [Candidatus Limnocylindrales bacterium]|nr:extracellular solute-binding protein [Candidatus Limnocylindrales bacterium]